MPVPILTPKLYIPRSKALIARPHLFERLNEGLECKLTLVAAPAGSGKTSLVSGWLQQINLSTAWLSLDAADSDPPRFISYFVAACQQIEPVIGQSIPDLLQSPQPPSLKTLMALIINDITSMANNNQWLLVLDDYHLIEDISIHEAMRFLLDHLPPHMHLIIITREDPPFPLPQLRVRRQITELRANDLRFAAPEIIKFFNQTTKNVNLSTEDIAALERRTEGWIAGLQLAALSLQNSSDPTGFIKEFAGDDRYIVDYLITEVLEQQPPHVLNFLQQTSILKRFTATLCQAVTGQLNVQEILTYLEEANLFLVALDNRRDWYRYHHLFGDLLYHRLRQTSPAQIPKLHALASRWYNKQGYSDDAIYHALTGEDYNCAADLIEQIGLQMIGQGRLNQVHRWIDSLPAAFIRNRPYLSVFLAWISVLHMQPDEAEAQLAHVEAGLQNLQDSASLKSEIRCQVAMIQGYITRLRRDLPASIAHIQQAIRLLPTDNEFLQCTAYLNLGGNYWVLGNFGHVEAPLQQAITFLDSADTAYPALVAAGYLTNAYLQRGQLREAAKLCQHVEQALTPRRPPPAKAYVAIEQGALCYEQNDLTTATNHLSLAVQLGEHLDKIVNIGRALLMLTWIKQVSGRPNEAAALLEQATAKRPPSVAEFEYWQVRLWLAQGNLETAKQWAETYDQQRNANRPWHGLNELTFACVLLADKQIERALDIVTGCETLARTAGVTGWLIRSMALKALCYQAMNNTELALSSLQQALSLAQPQGYCRTFIDHGLPMQLLLQQITTQDTSSAYVAQLLAAFPNSQVDDPIVNRKSEIVNLAESLNDREISILHLIAAGLSNREIAEELYLSTNTIKWYSSQIYGKLGVKKRAEAVDRAHELGIL